uniref:MFS transporter n=1 Tax=Tolypothrix bouteillei VB521301 TaxID=1479485 RepID=A0A0C1QRF7_9CYAN
MAISAKRLKRLEKREWLLWILTAATFLIFFQAYMVAPLIPHLASVFKVSNQTIGLIVPAYMIPYGVTSLVFGLVADRMGRKPVMLISLFAIIFLPMLTATAQSAWQLILWRLLTGLGASGTIPQVLTLIGELFPYEQRGRPLGWIFGAMAGGMAFGSVFGALLESAIGWRGLFIAIGLLAVVVFRLLWAQRQLLESTRPSSPFNLNDLLAGYKSLLGSNRGQRTYGYILFNGIFHSGIYTWLGLYFTQRYGFDEARIGLALLGYGIPGTLLGPVIGRAADRWGRNWLLPIGFTIAGLASAALIFDVPPIVATIAVTSLSLGYDMTQPLLAGIVTDLGAERRGQAMGLNVFTLFIGFGVGGFLFGEALRFSFTTALIIFTIFMLAASLTAIALFHSEGNKR